MCKELNIPEVRQQWIITAFALTSGCFLLLAGKLGDVYGRRILFILGCVCITAFSLGTAFSPTEICLYVMRALHGVVGFLLARLDSKDLSLMRRLGLCFHYSNGHWHHRTYDPTWTDKELCFCILLRRSTHWASHGKYTGKNCTLNSTLHKSYKTDANIGRIDIAICQLEGCIFCSCRSIVHRWRRSHFHYPQRATQESRCSTSFRR